MLGNAIEKNESDIANIVKKFYNFIRKTKNYLEKNPQMTWKRYTSRFHRARERRKVCCVGHVGISTGLICEVLDNVCSSLENNKDEVINKTFVNIKNLMSDRCNTQKKLVSCLWNLEKTF